MGPKGSAPLTEAGARNKTSQYSTFVDAFDTLQTIIPIRGIRGNLWPAWELFSSQAKEPKQAVDDWIEPLIRQTLEAKTQRLNGEKSLDEGSLLEHISQSTDDRKIIRDEVSSRWISRP